MPQLHHPALHQYGDSPQTIDHHQNSSHSQHETQLLKNAYRSPYRRHNKKVAGCNHVSDRLSSPEMRVMQKKHNEHFFSIQTMHSEPLTAHLVGTDTHRPFLFSSTPSDEQSHWNIRNLTVHEEAVSSRSKLTQHNNLAGTDSLDSSTALDSAVRNNAVPFCNVEFKLGSERCKAIQSSPVQLTIILNSPWFTLPLTESVISNFSRYPQARRNGRLSVVSLDSSVVEPSNSEDSCFSIRALEGTPDCTTYRHSSTSSKVGRPSVLSKNSTSKKDKNQDTPNHVHESDARTYRNLNYHIKVGGARGRRLSPLQSSLNVSKQKKGSSSPESNQRRCRKISMENYRHLNKTSSLSPSDTQIARRIPNSNPITLLQNSTNEHLITTPDDQPTSGLIRQGSRELKCDSISKMRLIVAHESGDQKEICRFDELKRPLYSGKKNLQCSSRVPCFTFNPIVESTLKHNSTSQGHHQLAFRLSSPLDPSLVRNFQISEFECSIMQQKGGYQPSNQVSFHSTVSRDSSNSDVISSLQTDLLPRAYPTCGNKQHQRRTKTTPETPNRNELSCLESRSLIDTTAMAPALREPQASRKLTRSKLSVLFQLPTSAACDPGSTDRFMLEIGSSNRIPCDTEGNLLPIRKNNVIHSTAAYVPKTFRASTLSLLVANPSFASENLSFCQNNQTKPTASDNVILKSDVVIPHTLVSPSDNTQVKRKTNRLNSKEEGTETTYAPNPSLPCAVRLSASGKKSTSKKCFSSSLEDVIVRHLEDGKNPYYYGLRPTVESFDVRIQKLGKSMSQAKPCRPILSGNELELMQPQSTERTKVPYPGIALEDSDQMVHSSPKLNSETFTRPLRKSYSTAKLPAITFAHPKARARIQLKLQQHDEKSIPKVSDAELERKAFRLHPQNENSAQVTSVKLEVVRSKELQSSRKSTVTVVKEKNLSVASAIQHAEWTRQGTLAKIVPKKIQQLLDTTLVPPLSKSNKAYHLKKILQTAIYGAVFLALEIPYPGGQPIRKTAIKVVSRDLEERNREQMQEDAWAEVKFWNYMKGHKNVLVFDFYWQDEDFLFIVMPYAEFEDLFELLKRRKKPLKEEQARWLFKQILEGARHLHKQGLAFRDHSLENILMFYDEGEGVAIPKITDPGQAVLVEIDENRRVKKMKSEKLFGKSFRAPEVYLKAPYHPLKVDTFSLGWMLFFTVTRIQAFDKALYQDPSWCLILHGKIDEVLQQKNVMYISPSFKDLVFKMLDPDPGKRPTLAQCLEHKWFSEPHAPIDYAALSENPFTVS